MTVLLMNIIFSNRMTRSVSYLQAAEDNFPVISAEPLDLNRIFAAIHHPEAGAVVLFSGETRNHSKGREVIYLEYEAQVSMATKMIHDILQEAISRWDLNVAFAQHRTGKVSIMEPAVVVVTASAHRTEAYKANKFIIDRIKHEAPIWKCEFFADGTSQWGGNCNCSATTGDPLKHVYDD